MKAIKLILPVIAFALASAGAVSNSGNAAIKKDGTVLINGWIQNPDPQHCSERKNLDCGNNTNNPVCMSFDATPKQVFLKNAADQCTQPLYKAVR